MVALFDAGYYYRGMFKRSLVYWMFVFFLFFLYFIHGFIILDPDFGWHVRMGQYVLSHGIPKTDPFSYSMPSYPFVDHEWLTNVGIALLYPLIGYMGLAIIFAGFVIGAFVIVCGKLRYYWEYLFFFLCSFLLLVYAGVRVQALGWVFFAILLWIVLHPVRWKKWKFGLPLLFFLWVNMHGSFAVGIGILILAMMTWCWEKRKYTGYLSDFTVVFLCTLVTLVNPYGWRMWWEVAVSVFDSQLHNRVAEWQPVFMAQLPALWLLIPFPLLLLFIYKKVFSLLEKILFVVLFFMAFVSVRHVPFWVIFVLPLLFRGLRILRRETLSFAGGIKRIKVAYLVTTFMVGVFCFWQGILVYQQMIFFAGSAFYPVGAVMYLRHDLPKKHILSTYDWGGYLLWKLPEKKEFVDGRMPSWRWKAPGGESNDAFGEFDDVFHEKIPLKGVVQKYGIDTIVIPNNFTEKSLLMKQSQFIMMVERFLHLSTQDNKKVSSFFVQMRKLGFRRVYGDTVAVVWERED